SGRREIAELLITKGVDINTNESGPTPLDIAIIIGRTEIAKMLITKGADVDVKNISGKTPLDLANEWKQKQIADFLRKHGGKTGEELKAEGK
ncbi:MAG: ankyrin repeat domain-containing protein, partial [Pirellulales bacterium]|nr:ankyrin repeat domain-containing protein [Pirellulales bacterium]